MRANQFGRTGDRPARPAAAPFGVPTAAALVIRNYDRRQEHELAVDVKGADAECIFRRQYYLQPNLIEYETAEIPPGEYEIHARLDHCHEDLLRCHIDDSLDGTAVIEVGNGILSLRRAERV